MTWFLAIIGALVFATLLRGYEGCMAMLCLIALVAVTTFIVMIVGAT